MAKDTSSPIKTISALDDHVLLGPSGLRISPLCLGTMTFGEAWGLGSNQEESKKVFDLYYEKFIYTACIYNNGESERFLGIMFPINGNTTYLQKDKGYNPNAGGNHRKSLVESFDASLKRLNMSYVDILYALYVAVSDIPSWALSRSKTIAELRGWSPFIGLIISWNHSMGRYRRRIFTGKYSKESAEATSGYLKAISKEIGRSLVQVSLNWTLQKPYITSPLIGAKTVDQLEENLKALEFKLDDVSDQTEVPFPNDYFEMMDLNLGHKINVPTRFETLAAKHNYGTRRNL
ncbi:NADP-dependent oxidoreductase domain-containing protein [Rhizophagus diaphanus]|nr:NADP-dependent oxidoreductase domain-containing protein [Rhizophagus diaphanus] [Rhizophagus sp. MUCL 43196]